MKSVNERPLILIAAALTLGFVGLRGTLECQAQTADNATGKSAAIDSVEVRFLGSDAVHEPDFQRHVVPLLGRLGCNGRACHGSFQGRGGFQLSLFGYDFAADHAALLDPSAGRIDQGNVDESLVLAKPLDADLHEGGKRFEQGSWQHHLLRRWIESGARNDSDEPQELMRLEVVPAEIRFVEEGESLSLRAVAHWEDGTSEDVTPLCRFSSNDDAVATISEHGQVGSGVRGDTHVVVYYDNAVVPVPVIRPFGPSENLAAETSPHTIDQLINQKIRKLGIQASPLCTDAEFIRRVSLDVTGILPSAQEVRSFLANSDPEKRQRLIDDLLESPGYAAWWATRFSDWTGNSEEQLNNVLPVRNAASSLWYEWLRARLEKNLPYDQIIEGIVTAQSRQSGESYLDYCKSMTQACVPGNQGLFAERDGLPLFWARQNFQTPEDRAIGFAYTFLGVRIECAQCHKHPFDQWSKQDFEQFAKVFVPIRVNQNQVSPDAKQERDALLKELTGDKELKGGELRKTLYEAANDGKVVPFGELLVNVRPTVDRAKKAVGKSKNSAKKTERPPQLPSGRILGQPDQLVLNQDPRPALMNWLRSPENPYFAKAIVNRVWSNYFGIGIVDPTDDMNLANPPVNSALLDHLAAEFIQHQFDLKWLHRTIISSHAYQRSATTNETNGADRTNFSRHVPRRLPAEVVYDAVVLATGSDQHVSKLREQINDLAIADGKPRRRNQQDFALGVFGQSIRESNCDCDRSDSPSLLQSIYLQNDADIHKRLTEKDGWVAQVCQELGVSGPVSDPGASISADARKAESMRKQFIRQIEKYRNLTERQQIKMRPQIEREHRRLSQKFEQMDLEVPSLESLLEDVTSWQVDSADIKTKQVDNAVNFASLVEEAYLRTLSRLPDEEEASVSLEFIRESSSPAQGFQSLLWALVNTKEFIITH